MTPARSIMIWARVIQLRKLAERTAIAYREAERRAKDREMIDRRADDIPDIPDEHRRLRAMLLGRLLTPPRKDA